MTTTTATTTATTIDSFLAAVAEGNGIPVDLYSPDAVLDATVPNWRFMRHGPEAIAAEYRQWFGSPGSFEELNRSPLPDGEAVTYLLTWTESGVPHAAHHCHILVLDDDGRIASDRVFCGGRWPAGLLAQMAAQS
jgi:SnoaL-like domain